MHERECTYCLLIHLRLSRITHSRSSLETLTCGFGPTTASLTGLKGRAGGVVCCSTLGTTVAARRRDFPRQALYMRNEAVAFCSPRMEHAAVDQIGQLPVSFPTEIGPAASIVCAKTRGSCPSWRAACAHTASATSLIGTGIAKNCCDAVRASQLSSIYQRVPVDSIDDWRTRSLGLRAAALWCSSLHVLRLDYILEHTTNLAYIWRPCRTKERD